MLPPARLSLPPSRPLADADDRGPRLQALNAEVAAGARTIDAWVAQTHGGLAMPHRAEEVTCC